MQSVIAIIIIELMYLQSGGGKAGCCLAEKVFVCVCVSVFTNICVVVSSKVFRYFRFFVCLSEAVSAIRQNSLVLSDPYAPKHESCIPLVYVIPHSRRPFNLYIARSSWRSLRSVLTVRV